MAKRQTGATPGDTFWRGYEKLRQLLLSNESNGSTVNAQALFSELERSLVALGPAAGARRRAVLEDLAALTGLRTGAAADLSSALTASPAPLPGLSLVTACMNRNDNLMRVLPSWLASEEIDEVVIVDWNSETPVAESLVSAELDDPRIRIARVKDEPRWILSYAFNVGFRMARHERVLKADADILLGLNFFSRNAVRPGEFAAGDWTKVEADQSFINGCFYAFRDDLLNIGGFNEYIRTYGWDDDEIYARLVASGLRRIGLDNSTLRHLDHDDSERMGFEDRAAERDGWRAMCRSTHHNINRNKWLCALMPGWGGQTPMMQFETCGEARHGPVLCRVPATEHRIAPHIVEFADLRAAYEMAAWRVGNDVFGVAPERLVAEIRAHGVDGLMPSILTETTTPTDSLAMPLVTGATRPRLFIDVQHGLGNRMRCMASAACVARRTGRELVVVWQTDSHCEARLHDLFDYHGAVEEQGFAGEARSSGMRLYNYMEVEDGSRRNEPIASEGSEDIYVRSAYILNSPVMSEDEVNHFLRALRPVSTITDMTESVRSPNDISVHVRMVGGEAAEHLDYEAGHNWSEKDHATIAHWRDQSHFDRFMKRIDALGKTAQNLFVAADNPETYAAFRERFGDRMACLERDVYDRSARQIQYGLADMILLSRAPLLLGSTWSSFSEVATRLADPPLRMELSGTDF